MKKIVDFYKYNGLTSIVEKIKYKFSKRYEHFIANEQIPTKAKMQQEIVDWQYQPRISVITPIYKPDAKELADYFSSLLEDNAYPNIELCLVVDGECDEHIINFIMQQDTQYPNKIKLKVNEQNQGISAASNDAIALSTGEYLLLVDQDDMIAPNALFEYVKILQAKQYDFLYSDEDMIDATGKRFNPNFKPDWSPHTLLSRMYVNHLSLYKKEIVLKAGGFRSEYDGCQDFDLLLRASHFFEDVYHCANILYHWRTSVNSIASSLDNKSYIVERAKKVIQTHLETLGVASTISEIGQNLIYDITFTVPQSPPIMTIFFAEESMDKNIVALDSLVKHSNMGQIQNTIYCFDCYSDDEARRVLIEKYNNVEYLVYHNDFAQINELILQEQNSELVLFMSANCYFAHHNDLVQLIATTELPNTGIVSPSIVDSNDVIIKSGGIFGSTNNIMYSGYGMKYGESDYYGANYSLVNYSFTTDECFLLDKKIFIANKGFSLEYDFQTAFLNLSLTLLQNNQYSVLNGNCKAICQEINNTPISTNEWQQLTQKWGNSLTNDRFYNVNFTKNKYLLYKIKKG